MSVATDSIELEYLPFSITAPGDSDLLFGATGLFQAILLPVKVLVFPR